MTAHLMRLRRFVTLFWHDTSGVMLPYVTAMMVVFVGLGALALDGGRYMSLQTQMQSVADALALAGARELNQQAGARTRATNAINNMVSNGLTGLGYSGAITYAAPVFYSALPVATAGFTGTPATSDQDARFVAVTVNPVTIPTIMPIPFFQAGGTNNFSAGAQAIAGFKNRAVCGISPVFICNPYETSGMTDSQATAALDSALDPNDPAYNPATSRKLFRMQVFGNNTSPGHFGWLQTPNNAAGCNPNSTPCLNQLIAYDSKQSLSRSCFDGSGVVMATGNKPVPDAFNDRFDIYSGNGPSADFTPAINVRKGYVAGKTGNWCTTGANPAGPGDYLKAQSLPTNANTTVPLATVPATVTVTTGTGNSYTATASVAGIQQYMSFYETNDPTKTLGSVTLNLKSTDTVATASGTAITFSSKPKAGSVALTFLWLTSDLPLDRQWTGLCSGGTCLQGNGDWDCANYWSINHRSAPPSGCTSSNPTLSRYQIYKTYENDAAGDSPTASPINDYSGYPRPTQSNGETGAPMCAINSGFTPTFDSTYDPRMVHVAVINCLAQTQLGNIGGGNSGPPTPVAGFAKYFLTQPYGADGSTYLYGEMTGLVNSLDQVRIMNQVQLYR